MKEENQTEQAVEFVAKIENQINDSNDEILDLGVDMPEEENEKNTEEVMENVTN